MITEQFKKLNTPDLLTDNNGNKIQSVSDWQERRKYVKEVLCNEEYGHFPKKHVDYSVETIKQDGSFCRGTIMYTQVNFTMHFDEGDHSFPVNICIPKTDKPCPTFLCINFYDFFPNRYLPIEEITDQGFAVVEFCYKTVTTDDGDFDNGIAKFFKCNKDGNRDFGKIMMWSYAAQHVMDYIQTLDGIDKNNIAVAGHSRLGKTALLTGAFDDRFKFTFSNDSGQSGAAFSRAKCDGGESLARILKVFPYWFCSNYAKYADNEDALPFDQNWLLSLVAPRHLYVASAEKDIWADPKSEFLCCASANEIYQLHGKTGLVHNDKYPETDQPLQEGDSGYHCRSGGHYLSRHDWNYYIQFIKSHL